MKFHCDRCKTRYSIADERVRGKILKIRCKNCSAVITVREPRDDDAPQRPGDDAARAADVAPPWFVAFGGIQHGPMSLAEAMAWVAQRNPAEAIYCWKEGFSGWLPVEDVEHFADLRDSPEPGDEPNFEGETVVAPRTYHGGGEGEPGESGGGPSGAEGEATSGPGSRVAPGPEKGSEGGAESTSASAALPESERGSESASGPFSAAPGESLAGSRNISVSRPREEVGVSSSGWSAPSGDELDAAASGGMPQLEFDEASRVIDVASLWAGAADGPGEGAPAQAAPPRAARIGEAPGSVSGSPDAALRIRRGRYALPLAVGAGALVIAGVALAVLLLRDTGGTDDQLARAALPEEHLGYRTDIEWVGPVSETAESEAESAGERADPTPRRDTGRATPAERRRGDEAPADEASAPPSRAERDTSSRAVGGDSTDEVDLGERGDVRGDQQPLSPDDLLDTYRSQQFLITRCYNRALDRDPELDVSSALVTITVEPSGRVGNVSIPSLSGTELGTCLESRIGGWRFRRSPESFTGEFRMMFGR